MERIAIYDFDGNQIVDPENSIQYATEIQFSSAAPKGYMEASFKVRRSDVFATWLVRDSYGVIIWDGATIVYQGRIETTPKDLQGADEYITVHCVGWWAALEERTIQKRWIDVKANSYLRWPDDSETNLIQTRFVNTKQENIFQVFAGTGDVGRNPGDSFRAYYGLPAGYVRKVRFRWTGRTGEQINLRIWNLAVGASYWVAGMINWPSQPYGNELMIRVSTGVPISSVAEVTFTLGNTPDFEVIWTMINDDLYDQNDYIHVSNMRVEAHYESGHRYAANPTYTQGQIIEDIILLARQKGQQISADFTNLGDPGLILDPYAVEKPTYAAQAIEQIIRYGDASLNTWLPYVWDKTGTSDGLPRFVLEAWSTSDWEYEVTLSRRELAALNYEKSSEGLQNNAIVGYTDSRDVMRYRSTSDATSIAAEYQRDNYIEIGQGDATRADFVGQRFVEFHKDRKTRGSISLVGSVRLKGGELIPANRVRAGQRFKLVNTGEVFLIRSTSYTAEGQTVRISPDLPVDNIAMLFAQRERKIGRLA